METIVNFLLLILVTVLSIGIGKGFDLKKVSSWLYVLCGFLIGPLASISTGDIAFGIEAGIFLALVSAWGGPIMFKRRQQYKDRF